jgi:hypothetical protein
MARHCADDAANLLAALGMFHGIYKRVAAKVGVGSTTVSRAWLAAREILRRSLQQSVRNSGPFGTTSTAPRTDQTACSRIQDMKSAKAFLVWRNTHAKRTLIKVPYALMDVAVSELLIDVPSFRS